MQVLCDKEASTRESNVQLYKEHNDKIQEHERANNMKIRTYLSLNQVGIIHPEDI